MRPPNEKCNVLACRASRLSNVNHIFVKMHRFVDDVNVFCAISRLAHCCLSCIPSGIAPSLSLSLSPYDKYHIECMTKCIHACLQHTIEFFFYGTCYHFSVAVYCYCYFLANLVGRQIECEYKWEWNENLQVEFCFFFSYVNDKNPFY